MNSYVNQINTRSLTIRPLFFISTLLIFGLLLSASADKPADTFGWTLLEVTDTLNVYAGEKPAGNMTHRIRVDSSAKRIRETNTITLGNGGMQVHEYCEYDWRGDLVRTRMKMKSPAGENRWELQRNEHGEWVLQITAGGVSTKRNIQKVAGSLTVTRDIMRRIVSDSIEVGEVWYDTLFSLTSAKNVPISTTCRRIPGGKDRTWVFVNRDELTNMDEVWEVDKKGRLVRQEIPPMFVARRKQDDGTDFSGRQIEIDQFSQMFSVPAGPHKAGTNIVVSGDSLEMHSSVRQFYRSVDGGFRLLAMPSACGSGTESPDSGYLKGTPTMQVDAEPVRGLADSLSRGVSDRCEIIHRAWSYVFNTLEKRNVATFSSALETLNAGYGDCGEHAVTLGAILRACGIPARVVLGLVHLDYKEGYYYHAWVMVHDGGRWLFVDPALGRNPATNGYIPLVIDDTGEDAAYLARYMGKMNVSYASASDQSNEKSMK